MKELESLIFAVETSCDETAISIVKTRVAPASVCVLAHLVESQTESHAPFGGVVPEIASRDHLAKIHQLATQALQNANIQPSEIGAVAVTMGPGLIGALMVGILFARGFALSLGVPLLAVNHVDAHLAPALLLRDFSSACLGEWHDISLPPLPALTLTVSGGHCHLGMLTGNVTNKIILGKSLDDACGEAFDKVAKLLGLGYPGGPLIERLAKVVQGEPNPYVFPHKIADKSQRYAFSYSGLKTAVMHVVRQELGIKQGKIEGHALPLEKKQMIASAFQEAALAQLLDRVRNALSDHPEIASVVVAGGVAQNQRFRELFATLEKPLFFAPKELCSDNATMIALWALYGPKQDGFSIQPYSRYEL